MKNRAPPPKAWRWEIYRAGNVNPIKQSSIYFETTAAARRPQGAVEQALRLIQMVPGHVDKIIDARHPAEIEPHPNERADIVRLIDEYEANQKAKVA